jgi:K+-transporting ATPase ATPase C chain
MLKELKNAVACLLLLTVITGAAYPLAVTAIAQLAFKGPANGSILNDDAGSSLIAQPFDDPKYFWPRLSGANYNAAASSGTNFAPTNPALVDAAKARIAALKAADPANDRAIPVDLVTASGSGLDPHISLAAAEYQVDRIARIRSIDAAKVRRLVSDYAETPSWGFAGEPRVNVLAINLALEGKLPPHPLRSAEFAGGRGRAFQP